MKVWIQKSKKSAARLHQIITVLRLFKLGDSLLEENERDKCSTALVFCQLVCFANASLKK